MILSKLKAIRLDQALSLRALSALSGVSATTIIRAERGEDVYTVTVRRLARALGVKPSELTGTTVPRPIAAPREATLRRAMSEAEERRRRSLAELEEDAKQARARGDLVRAKRYEDALAAARRD